MPFYRFEERDWLPIEEHQIRLSEKLTQFKNSKKEKTIDLLVITSYLLGWPKKATNTLQELIKQQQQKKKIDDKEFLFKIKNVIIGSQEMGEEIYAALEHCDRSIVENIGKLNKNPKLIDLTYDLLITNET